LRKLSGVYEGLCPNCGGPCSEERLSKGLPCRKCLPRIPAGDSRHIGELLAERGVLRRYGIVYKLHVLLQEFEDFFEKATGHKLWPVQKLWARRLLRGESFAIIAPTGVGKTTLLSVYCLWLYRSGRRPVYYILPTENLVNQVYEKLTKYAERLGIDARIIRYHSHLRAAEKREAVNAIKEGAYDILVTTSSFLARQQEGLLRGAVFEAVIVDDVDAMLRSPKSIKRVLVALGFTPDAVDYALKTLRLRLDILAAKVRGRKKKAEILLQRLIEAEARLADAIAESNPGQLIIASATGRAYGLHSKIFNKLLGFEIGRLYDALREVDNFHLEPRRRPIEEAAELIARLGPGGIVYFSTLHSDEEVEELVARLSEKGIKAVYAKAGRSTKALKMFASGEADVIIGKASYYGTIVRGIDLPYRIKYAVFVGVPVRAQPLDKAVKNPRRLVRLAISILPGDEEVREAVKLLSKLTPSELQLVYRIIRDDLQCKTDNRVCRLVGIARGLAEKILTVVGKLPKPIRAQGAAIIEVNGELLYVTPDTATFVQASGRTSRLLNGGMTHGVVIVIEENRELVDLLAERLQRFMGGHVAFQRYDPVKVRESLRLAEETRKGRKMKKVHIETCCIIVESPTKAKTIANFFGKPAKRRVGPLMVYEASFFNPLNNTLYIASVTASIGHIYDLTIEEKGVHGVVIDNEGYHPVYAPIKRCLSCGKQFAATHTACPYCGSTNIEDKFSVIEALRQLALESGKVYLATDPDVEGEKIAWDLYLALRPYAEDIERIELHSITRGELYRALANPRRINPALVAAQVVRRIEDRWIGFSLSRHIQEKFGRQGLGAGRVQTPVLGWIIARYREWRRRRCYVLLLRLTSRTAIRLYIHGRDKLRELVEEASNGVAVEPLRIEEVTLNPPPPYTTEELLFDASARYRYTAEKTMKLAQELFETGLITYHRTDSTHVSSTGIEVAKKYLSAHGLAEEFKPRAWGPPGHHEAIRPTMPHDPEELRQEIAVGNVFIGVRLRESHFRLYELIFRRFMASQMVPAVVRRVDARVVIGDVEARLTVYIDAVRPGFLRMYDAVVIDKEFGNILGRLVKPLEVRTYKSSEVRLYTHGDVVALMKKNGIGRPSTYARTLTVLRQHGYVIESKYRKYLVPTRLGVNVYTYLVDNFNRLVSLERTRMLYEKMRSVEEGRADPVELVDELYRELYELSLLEHPLEVVQASGSLAEAAKALS